MTSAKKAFDSAFEIVSVINEALETILDKDDPEFKTIVSDFMDLMMGSINTDFMGLFGMSTEEDLVQYDDIMNRLNNLIDKQNKSIEI